MERIFKYGDQEFNDPGPQFTTEMVRQHLANFFPELAQATSEVEEKGDKQVVTFRKQAGRKGIDAREIAARLGELPAPGREPVHLFTELERLERSGQLSAETLAAMQAQIEAAIGRLEKHINLAKGVTQRCLRLRPVPSRRLPGGF